MRPSTLAWGLACALVLAPAAAQAEPVTALYSATPGFVSDPSGFNVNGPSINIGNISLDAGSQGYIFIQGLDPHANYMFSFKVADSAGSAWHSLTAEVLDPLSDGFDEMDPSVQPVYIPAGFSTSNNTDGLSFAWNSSLLRSATFARGGQAALFVDENSNDRDALQFNNFTGGDVAAVTFGLRDNSGGRGFLVRLSVDGAAAPTPNPEPASIFLLGSGLVGLARYGRRGLALR